MALYLACRDTRVPWYAKAFAAALVAYALSPIDLIRPARTKPKLLESVYPRRRR